MTNAFVLFGILHGVTAAIDGIIDSMSDTRLIGGLFPAVRAARLPVATALRAV